MAATRVCDVAPRGGTVRIHFAVLGALVGVFVDVFVIFIDAIIVVVVVATSDLDAAREISKGQRRSAISSGRSTKSSGRRIEENFPTAIDGGCSVVVRMGRFRCHIVALDGGSVMLLRQRSRRLSVLRWLRNRAGGMRRGRVLGILEGYVDLDVLIGGVA